MEIKIMRAGHDYIQLQVSDEVDPAIFPKYCKVGKVCCQYKNENEEWAKRIEYSIQASIEADEVNKGYNEAGIKRLKKFVDTLEKVYGPSTWKEAPLSNSITSAEIIAIINSK